MRTQSKRSMARGRGAVWGRGAATAVLRRGAAALLCGAVLLSGAAGAQGLGSLPAPEPAVPAEAGREQGAHVASARATAAGATAAGATVTGATVKTGLEGGRGARARPGFPFLEKKARLRPGDPKLDLNTAPVAELVKLPGVGRKRAEQIVALREKRPFRRVLELRRVRGIGRKTMQRLLPLVTLTAPKATAKLAKAAVKKPKKPVRKPLLKPGLRGVGKAKLTLGKAKVRVAKAPAAPAQ